ncbi:mammalian cell entry protein, partial [Mycobacteroides abscessus subsp. bolletii]|nr:mammalian cell entry protein [Mycobacteroides abscessus subsp. bolletii]
PPGGPNLTDPNPPLPPWQPNPSPRVPGTADPDLLEPPPPPPPPIPAAPVAPASFGGNVGPVGSPREKAQIRAIAGERASSSTQLLLGPVVRGTTVSLAKEGSR